MGFRDESELKVHLTADAARFISGFSAAGGSLTGFLGRMVSVQGAIVGIAGALATVIKTTADYGDALFHNSQKTGIAVERLSEYQYAAKLSNLENEQLVQGLVKLNKTILAAASGNTEAIDSFKQMKVDFRDLHGEVRNGDDVFRDLISRFSSMDDETLKSAFSLKFFGRSGAEFIEFLNQGSEGLARFTAEAHRMNATVTADQAKAAADFNDNIDRIKEGAKGAGRSVGNKLIVDFNNLFGTLSKVAKKLDEINHNPFLVKMTSGFRFWSDMFTQYVLSPLQLAKTAMDALGKSSEEDIFDKTFPPVNMNSITGHLGGFPGGRLSPPFKPKVPVTLSADEKRWMDPDHMAKQVEAGKRITDDFWDHQAREVHEGLRISNDAWKAYLEKLARDYSIAAQEIEQAIADAGAIQEQIGADLTRDWKKAYEANQGFFGGWKEGLKDYVTDTESAFGWARDMAKNAASSIQSSFQTFFFDAFKGKIDSLKTLLASFADFATQVISNILAQLATTKLLQFITGAATSAASSGAGAASGFGNEGVATTGSLQKAMPVTLNVINSGREDRPQISTRKELGKMVIDIVYRDFQEHGVMRAMIRG